MHSHLEIACFHPDSALLAAKAGADRIELGQNYAADGTTPALSDFQSIRSQIKVPIYVLIREREGDFAYSGEEARAMQDSIKKFKDAGADGFVFGCLNKNKEIDLEHNWLLLSAACGLPCTFHRAIDEVADFEFALQVLESMGFKNILSSGRKNSALEGVDLLNKMKKLSGLQIIAGGGVRSAHITQLKEKFTGLWYHSSCILNDTYLPDETEIQKIKKLLNT